MLVLVVFQVLAAEGMVEKYLHNDVKSVGMVRKTFAGLWGFDSSDPTKTTALIKEIRANPSKYVIKPQLEGGGNNIYGENIVKFLDKSSLEQLDAFIAMERIFPANNQNYLVRPDAKVELVDTVSELGVYGYLIGDMINEKILMNKADGHLLRTKTSGVDEGGIMAGASSLDSPYLI